MKLMRRNRESGYVLIGVLVLVTLMMIALAAVAPAIGTQIKRDREDELVRRGKQYTRAIQLYYRKFGRFPASIEQLENTNNIRFLRRKYIDPITGKDEWRLIRFGQAKPKQLPAWQKGSAGGGITNASAMSSTGTGVSGTGGAAGASGSGSSNPGQGSSIGVSAADISKPLSGSSSIGSGGIVGVSSTSEKKGLKEIDGKTKYNEWEFVYDPTLDPLMRGGQGMGQGGGPGVNPQQNPANPSSNPNPGANPRPQTPGPGGLNPRPQ
jgi:type II secretory pathway pseudopilin PulG